jgi:hypothetical protein
MNSKDYIKQIILEGTSEEKRELFSFDSYTLHEKILKKFHLFARGLYPRYFKHKNAPFHDEMILDFIVSYYGKNYQELAFRGSAKTTFKKLFDVFVLLNDKDGFRRYIKVLTKDGKNSKQIVTDVYNLIVEVRSIYGNPFEKQGDTKREETMSSFTTKDGRKYTSGTIGQTQRGHVQDANRPDWVWFDDVEDRESISSITITQGIIDKCDEAITGLSKNGSFVVTGNYISDTGVIEWFKSKSSVITKIYPIIVDGKPSWDIYSLEEIEVLKTDSNDFYGEYMCDPKRSKDKFFDIARIERDLANAKPPDRESAGIKYWINYLSHHSYGIGGDTAEGVGRDSNAMTLFDFKTGEVGATFHNNMIDSGMFGHEMMRLGSEFGNCIIAPEKNNTGYATLETVKDYPNVYKQREIGETNPKAGKPGWSTNSKTKPNMFFEFRRDYNDGLIKIYSEELLKEMKAYTNADLQDKAVSVVTRHFDLLTSACIGWQMRNFAEVIEEYQPPKEDYQPLQSSIGL